jgi:hypothetical protein
MNAQPTPTGRPMLSWWAEHKRLKTPLPSSDRASILQRTLVEVLILLESGTPAVRSPGPRGVLGARHLVPHAARAWLSLSAGVLGPLPGGYNCALLRSRWQRLSQRGPGRSLQPAQDIEGPGTRQHHCADGHPLPTAGAGRGVHAEHACQEGTSRHLADRGR